MIKILFSGSLLIFAGLLFAISHHNAASKQHWPQNPQKIASLAPAITETLFALGLGDRIGGVTQFCQWPPEAATKPKIGGFREVNPEELARAGSDLVILPADMGHFKNSIEDMGIPVTIFDYGSLRSFLDSTKKLAKITGREKYAAKLATDFAAFGKPRNMDKRPSVLFIILNPGEYDKPPAEMTIIGADAFYNEIIESAGGQNIYKGKTPFPRLSLETVFAMDPDVIVIGAPGFANGAAIEKQWADMGHLKSVKNGRLLVLNDPGDTIPGPRSLETLRKLSRIIQSTEEDSR